MSKLKYLQTKDDGSRVIKGTSITPNIVLIYAINEVKRIYPQLDDEQIMQALEYAIWQMREKD